MHINVCVYVYINVCIYKRMNVYVYEYINVYIYINPFVCIKNECVYIYRTPPKEKDKDDITLQNGILLCVRMHLCVKVFI